MQDSEEQAHTLIEFCVTHIETMLEKIHLHMTPDCFRIRLDGGQFAYKYMKNNKPFSVLDWMEYILGLNHTTNQPVPPEIENDIIVLINPDMADFTLSHHDARLLK